MTEGKTLTEKFLDSKKFTTYEKDYVMKYQMGQASVFERMLYELIHVADDSNRDRLRKAFPDEVAAVKGWNAGDLAERCRKVGLPV